MYTVNRAVLVNDSHNPHQLILTADQLWRGLVIKQEDSLPFVPGMTSCEVVERHETYLVRDIIFLGESLRERIVFHPPKKVETERLSGKIRGKITNEIEEKESGELLLYFSFALEAEGIPVDSPEEQAYFQPFEENYVGAVQTTLATIRSMVTEGKLKTLGRYGA